MSKERQPEPLDFFIWTVEGHCFVIEGKGSSKSRTGLLLMNYSSYIGRIRNKAFTHEMVFKGINAGMLSSQGMNSEPKMLGYGLKEINLGGYGQIFKENGVNGEYLDSLSTFTTEQILRFIRRCHMKWGDFITLCKELRRIKVALLKGEEHVRRPWWAPPCLSVVFVKVAKHNRQSRVVSLKQEP